MTGLNEKKNDTEAKSYSDLVKKQIVDEQTRLEIGNKPITVEKHVCKYHITRFKDYLISRISKWERLSSKQGNGNTYAKHMLKRTNSIIDALNQDKV